MFLLAFADVQLIPDGTVFIHIAIILIMIWVLNRTFFKPINKILDTRAKNSGGRMGEAEGLLREVNEKQAKYNKEMFDARNQGYEIIEAERAGAVALREAEIGQVKQETTQKLETEKVELENQTAEARKTIAAEAEKMAEKISSNILKSA